MHLIGSVNFRFRNEAITLSEYFVQGSLKDSGYFSGDKQVKNLGLENSKDLVIWEFARTNGFCILTFDNDFYDIGLLKGSPPKIIWMRTGNTKTINIVRILRKNYGTIKAFLTDPVYNEIGCLEIGT